MKRQIILTAMAVALLSFLVGAQSQASLISEKQELQMGQDGAKQIESQYKVSSDPTMNALVESIGRKVAAVSTRPGLQWQFKVLDVSDVNAVSVPAYVYVNRGLIEFVGSDTAALAGVIAHEIGHTCGKHAVKSAEQQLKYGLLLGLLKSGNTQNLGNMAANFALLGYSRKDEYQADKYGVDFMTKAGYDPNGMLRFFKKLQQKEGSDSKGLSVYFQTHPPTDSRITRVQQEMKRIGAPVR